MKGQIVLVGSMALIAANDDLCFYSVLYEFLSIFTLNLEKLIISQPKARKCNFSPWVIGIYFR